MSCNICHTPILVNPQFLDPDDIETVTQKDHLDPIVEQVCPSKIHQPYFKSVIQLDRRCEGVVLNRLSHAGRGLFFSSHWKITGGMGLFLKQENIKDGTSTCSMNVAHEGCWKLLCHKIGVPFDLSQKGRETLVALVERHEILGITLFGGYEGIDYSEGKLEERWLVEPYGCGEANQFAWDFENGQQDWTMKRPDLFPRLHETVKPQRLELCDNSTPSNDILSNCPDLVFLDIAKYLPLSDLYSISILNKNIRRRCLTNKSFQNSIRAHLFNTWATPSPSEYPPKLHPGYPYHTAAGDWLLYGYHVYKTASMRNRRRIFNLINQLESQYLFKGKEQGYLSGPYSEQQQNYLRAIIDQQLLLRKLNEMYDFELFIKCITVLNDAYSQDLRKSRLMGTQLPSAVGKVKKLMVGKVALAERRPGRIMERRLAEKVNERLKFNLTENRVWRRARVAKSQGETIF